MEKITLNSFCCCCFYHKYWTSHLHWTQLKDFKLTAPSASKHIALFHCVPHPVWGGIRDKDLHWRNKARLSRRRSLALPKHWIMELWGSRNLKLLQPLPLHIYPKPWLGWLFDLGPSPRTTKIATWRVISIQTCKVQLNCPVFPNPRNGGRKSLSLKLYWTLFEEPASFGPNIHPQKGFKSRYDEVKMPKYFYCIYL